VQAKNGSEALFKTAFSTALVGAGAEALSPVKEALSAPSPVKEALSAPSPVKEALSAPSPVKEALI